MPQPEIERIVETYRDYDSQGAVSRWQPLNPGNRRIHQERRQAMREMLRAHGFEPLAGRKILEIGCGRGLVLSELLELGARPAQLYGIDLLIEHLESARRLHPEIRLQCANAECLPFPDAEFDLVVLFTVFSSILDDAAARNVAGEARRVLKAEGGVLWYDFRYGNPRNANVRGITKKRLGGFFPGFTPYLRTLTLLPPLARRLGAATQALYPMLAGFALLRTHYLGMLRPAGAAAAQTRGRRY